MEVVELRPLPLVHEHPERDVERLFARPTDPEVAVPLLLHLDEALLEEARLQHEVVHLHEHVGGEARRVGAVVRLGKACGHGVFLDAHGPHRKGQRCESGVLTGISSS